MKKLPHGFRPALEKIGKLDNFGKEKSAAEIFESYQNINRILKEQRCEFYDMNNVIHNYNTNSAILPIVNTLRKIMSKRNRLIFKKAARCPEWDKCLKRLKKSASRDLDRYVHTKEVENGLIRVLQNYADHWLGFWTIIDVSESGGINSVELFDTDDQKMFLSHLQTD